jgi:mono/diheme cytochrome c family protein
MASLKKILALAQFCILLAFVVIGLSCRGYMSEQPPVHPNLNMDIQEKGKAYRESDFFDNGTCMREPIAGTIYRGGLKEDEHFYYGKIDGKPALGFPQNIKLDDAFLKRGQLVFNRTCAACHNQVGDGDGLVGRRLMVKPTSLHSAYMYEQLPGHYYDVISNGIRTMMPYGHMISVADRWAVVAYIRVLQMSQDIDGDWIKRSASWWKQQ